MYSETYFKNIILNLLNFTIDLINFELDKIVRKGLFFVLFTSLLKEKFIHQD